MTQEELKLVRDVLEQMEEADVWEVGNAIAAINKALANVATNDTSKEYVDEMQKQRHEQEPVAWPCLIAEADFSENTVILAMQCTDYKVSAGNHWLSNTPPQRIWVGLTDEEVDECYYWKDRQWTTDELVRHVEAKLKQKNGFAEEKNT